jgi:hypothetical protein
MPLALLVEIALFMEFTPAMPGSNEVDAAAPARRTILQPVEPLPLAIYAMPEPATLEIDSQLRPRKTRTETPLPAWLS